VPDLVAILSRHQPATLKPATHPGKLLGHGSVTLRAFMVPIFFAKYAKRMGHGEGDNRTRILTGSANAPYKRS
jgi:hypothetical protein